MARLDGPWLWPAVFVLLLLAARIWFARTSSLFYEDALITLRYSENIASGRGFVYNVGERVLGTTAPLFALLLAACATFFGADSLREVAVAVGVIADAGSIALFFCISRCALLPQAVPLTAAGLFVAAPYLGVTGVSGMETPLVVFLMLASLALWLMRRFIGASVLLGMLVLCRIDAMVWVAVLVGVALVREHRFRWTEATVFSITVFPWLLFATLYFGSPIPHTIVAKMVAYPARGAASSSHFFEIWKPLHELSGPAVLAALLDAAFVLGTAAIARRRRELLALPAFCFAYFAFLFLAVPQMFSWYLVPLMAAVYFVAAVGAAELAGWLTRLPMPAAPRAVVAALVPAALVLGEGGESLKACGYWTLHMQNERLVREGLGIWLRDNTPESASIYTEPIGFIGYYSKRYIWDSVGLVSPKITEYRRRFPGYLWFARSLEDLQPQYVVLRSYERKQNLMFLVGGPLLAPEDEEWFDAHYELVREVDAPNDSWGKLGSLSVFARRTVPSTP